jgi:carboxyl-terminal processing protease
LTKERVRGVVLDLRGNGGGSLEEAISLTGLFIRQGPVVQTRGLEGEIEVGVDKDASVQYDGPLLVLTNRFSASATEILAGALQDYGRAVVVGDSSTFGKGTVQSILPLGMMMDRAGITHTYDPGALKVTMSKFYRPDGASTQLRGVASDIVLPSPSDLSDVNEVSLKNPLPWDAVAEAPHERLNRVQPYLATLREKSHQRVSTEKAFAYLAEDVARLKKNLAEKSISLNEVERRREIAQIKDLQEQHKQEELAHPILQPQSYEITLKNAALPGLPPPTVAKKDIGDNKVDKESDGLPTKPTSDILLLETVKILGDYTGLLDGRPQGPRLAGPRESRSAL